MWRHVQHQPPQEFHGIERQSAQAVAMLVVLITEGHLAILQSDEPMVRNGDAVGIAGSIFEDVLRILERLFGVDHPLLVTQRGEEALPGGRFGKLSTTTRQGELALAIEVREPHQIQPPKTPREDADGQEEVRPTRHPLGAI